MEILSPAGNINSLTAALRSGADAVYFGVGDFNARKNAENFQTDDLKNIIKLCKIEGVKCYLTLNTLIKNEEIINAFNIAKLAYKYGIDGVIVQDLGLISLLNKYLPNLNLHASTQMAVHSSSALPFLKKLGIKRVVIARECSKKTIKEITAAAKNIGIETEVFVHGALCMSLSGQCYFSASLGGRSANRGLCAGPCRLPHKAENGTGFDLSLKDLSLLKYIKELADMGVSSAKIEGRMKAPEYVACATYCFKKALKNENFSKEALLLKDSFSRSGFTDGYYNYTLGINMFGVRSEEDKILTDKAKNKIHELYRKNISRIPVKFNLTVKADEKITLSATAFKKTATVVKDKPQKAQTAPFTAKKAEETLCKIGFSPYYFNGGEFNIEDGLFVENFNVIKKEVLQKLDELRAPTENKIPKKAEEFIKNYNVNYPKIKKYPKIIIELNEDVESIDFNGIDYIVLPLSSKLNIPKSVKKVAKLSRYIKSEEALYDELKKAKENGFSVVLCSNIGHIAPAAAEGFSLAGGFSLNVFNSEAFNLLNEMYNFEWITFSAELSKKELFEAKKTALFAYGKLPLMLTANCPIKNGGGCKNCNHFIIDRKNKKLPVYCFNGYSEIFNSIATNIGENYPFADYMYLKFIDEQKEEVKEIIEQYKSNKFNTKNYTKALFKNGVI